MAQLYNSPAEFCENMAWRRRTCPNRLAFRGNTICQGVKEASDDPLREVHFAASFSSSACWSTSVIGLLEKHAGPMWATWFLVHGSSSVEVSGDLASDTK